MLSVTDLVVAADHLILTPPFGGTGRPFTTRERLQAAVEAHPVAGMPRARTALDLVRPGAESRTETLLRLLLRDHGLPEPTVNPTVEVRTLDGRFRIVRLDLAFCRWKVAVEYDGDHHRTDARQYELDIARYDDITADGWIDIRVRSYGLFVEPLVTVARVHRALRSRGWRPSHRTRAR
ncbi:hypothetical protein [Marisediminicola sp. LYQ85]|uniref:hypothetical protein n=1 Tax=Marisediminicola sp. LYQ85 TaxID=3391062 RepID=UPI0039832F63